MPAAESTLMTSADALPTRSAVAAGTLPASGLPRNLPVQLSSFVGRAGELAGLAAAVARWPVRS
jgi:hypothetical protein